MRKEVRSRALLAFVVLVLASGCASSRARKESMLRAELGLRYVGAAIRAMDADECADVRLRIGGGSQYARASSLAANATAPEVLTMVLAEIAKFEARSDATTKTMIDGSVEIHRPGQCGKADGFKLTLEDP